MEWACWLVDLMLNSKSNVLNQRVRDPNIIDALQKYIQKKSSPYKSRVVVLLARLLSDVTMYERHQQHQTNAEDGMGGGNNSNSTYMGPPDLTLMNELCRHIFEKAAAFKEANVPPELKPILELACVAKLGDRAFTRSEWMYGTKLKYQSQLLRTPLTPRVQMCPKMKHWNTGVSKQDAMMDIIIITQCITSNPPLRLPDQLLVQIWRNANQTKGNTGTTLSKNDMKNLEYLARVNSKWTTLMDNDLMIWIVREFSGCCVFLWLMCLLCLLVGGSACWIGVWGSACWIGQFLFATRVVFVISDQCLLLSYFFFFLGQFHCTFRFLLG